MPARPSGFGYRGGGRKGLAGRMNKAPKPPKAKKAKLPTLGFK